MFSPCKVLLCDKPCESGRDLAEWLERLTADAVVATVQGSIQWNLRGGR